MNIRYRQQRYTAATTRKTIRLVPAEERQLFALETEERLHHDDSDEDQQKNYTINKNSSQQRPI